MGMQRHEGGRIATKTGGAALGALMGSMLGGPLGPMIGGQLGAATAEAVGPLLTPLMEAWVAKMRQELLRRGRVVAAGAAEASSLEEGDVVQRLLDSDGLQPLVARVLEAAARSGNKAKLGMLGAVLGEAVSSRPRSIDESLLIVAALEDLEGAHLRVLEALEGVPDFQNPDVRWTSEGIDRAVPDLTAIGRSTAIGGLIRHGLVDTTTVFDGTGYQITDFGQAMLEAFRLRSAAG